MPKNCLFLVLLLLAASSYAQVKIGIIGGPQSASITETNSIAGWQNNTGRFYTNKSGIHAGVMAQIPFGSESRFFFMPAITYSEKGRNFSKYLTTQSADTVFSYKTTSSLLTQYIELPLNIGVKLPLSKSRKNNFLISAGPYLSLFYNGKYTLNQNDQVSDNTGVIDIEKVNKTTVLEVGKKDDSYRTFGYGANARAGFELGNVTLTGFYSLGLDNLYYAPYKGTFHHKVYGASLGIWLGQTKEVVVVKDKDHDGVPDKTDACPLEPGTAITNGCPDKDGDGIADKNDKCPDVAGLVKYNGCPVPDTDGDGVNDEQDKCPTVKGLAKYNGCPVPDTDKDGIDDENDKCPTAAGTAKYNGCPIPDTDADGINDELDKCPTVAGVPDNNGCPVIKEEIRKQVAFAAQNIFFATNSATLLSKSFEPLNSVAKILEENPDLQIVIDGYTDNTGSLATNMAISAKRAEAVKAYLVGKGVPESRLSAAGHGPANPIGDNKTAAGRTQNRRVELKLKQ